MGSKMVRGKVGREGDSGWKAMGKAMRKATAR
jgi:hypothetical protein